MNNGKETGDIQIVTGGSTVYDNFVTGTLIIEDGGRAYRSDVAGGGKLIVESGGVAAGFTVADSDSVSYDFHAEVDGRGENNVHIVSAPESAFNYEITVRQDVLDGCIAFQCKVADGAVQEIADGGEASYTLVREGGLQLVRGGARANVTTVEGQLELESGAVSNYAVVERAGEMVARSGSIVNNVTVNAGGLLKLEDGAVLGGITWAGGRIEAAADVNAHTLVLGLVTSGEENDTISPDDIPLPLLNDLTFFRNTDLRVAVAFDEDAEDRQPEGEYKLAGNAAGFTGSITVTSSNYPDVFATLSVGDSYSNTGLTLTLSVNAADELILTVGSCTEDTAPPDPVRAVSSMVYDSSSVMIRWEDGTDDIGVTRYELRYVREGASKEKTVKSAEPHCLLDNLAPGSYSYQVRAIDATGKTGEWSEERKFLVVPDSDDDAPEGPVLSTTLWGHDYLPELYTSPQPAKPNDVGGCYFADAEKLNELQDQLYCWAGTTANLLTWGGWAANSPLAFADEDETLEYFIDYWKNEGGQDRDAFSWFVNGTGDSGDIIVPAEGGNLFPTLDAGEYQFTVTADEAGGDFAVLLLSSFNAGYGVGLSIYSDAGMAHAITGWGYEVVGNDIYLYYSDSDSDYWDGSFDRREAPNRLSKTKFTFNRKDGRFYLEDYQVSDAYLGEFTAIRQFDKIFLGENETFDDARQLEFSDGQTVRAGNIDGREDDDYYVFSTQFTGEIDIRVAMNCPAEFLSGITVSLFDAAKNLIWQAAEAALEQVYSFIAAANLNYYLKVEGDAFTADNTALPLELNTYRVEVTKNAEGELHRQAGTSDADDTWQQVAGSASFSTEIPGGRPEVPAGNLFSIPLSSAGGEETVETSNWVGKADRIDLRELRLEQAGSYDFAVSGVSEKLKLTVYRLKNGKLKKVKSVSVTAKTKEEKRGLFGLNLEAGECYVAVESSSRNGTFYDVSFEGEVFVNAERGDDTWALAAGDPDYTVSTVKYDSAFMILNPYSLFNTNWVGFGDTADYRALELLDSGSYNFTVSQLAGKATGKFTLWKLRDDGKLKKMFTVNAGSKKPAVKSNVLLESGSYVIAFESKNWKSGHNTDYTVMLDGTAFGQANRREDNDWQHATAVTEGEAVREEWVGFSDLKDYFRFEVAADSECSLLLSGATGKDAKITLYRRKTDKNGNEKNPVRIASQRTADGLAGIDEFLSAGIYYFSVEAQGGAKKSGTNYDIDLTLNRREQTGMLA